MTPLAAAGPDRAFLKAMAILATLFLILGILPWNRGGTPWRPSRPALEAKAAGTWDHDLIARSQAYRSEGYGRYFFRKGLVGLLFVVVLTAGWHTRFRALAFFRPGTMTGAVVGATLALFLAMAFLDFLTLPFALIAFQKARAVGLSVQSLGSWFADWGKGLAIDWLLTIIVGGGFACLIRWFPGRWAVPAAILAGLGGVVLTLLIPVVIDPLFNTFTPLTDRALADRFLDLARRGGVPAKEVLVSDASKKTTAVNAYFTGFGPTRRIVVYDTMVSKLPPKESELVLAHEVGHWARHHIVKGLVVAALGLLVGLLLAQAFLGVVVRGRWFGIDGPLDPAAIPFYLLVYWLVLFVELPIENAVSRVFESEADRFALDLTHDPATQIAVEKRLATTNLPDLVPPPFIEMLLYTHPKSLDRIGQAEEWARRNGVDLTTPDPTP